MAWIRSKSCDPCSGCMSCQPRRYVGEGPKPLAATSPGPILPVPYLDFTVSTAVRNFTKCRDFDTTAL